MQRISTFSLVAYDPAGKAWGIAVASKFPAVGAVVPWARAGAGAVATQSYANTSFGPDGLELMEADMPAGEALHTLLEADEEKKVRQVGMVDASGHPASFTGEDCIPWAGGRCGEHYAMQGNLLTGEETLEAMEAAYLASTDPFPERLVAALLAADRAGGDRRGRQSAAVLVVKEDGGYGGYNDRWIDYRIDDHPDPVPQLQHLLKLHQLYFGKSDAEDQLPLEGDTLAQLLTILHEQDYLSEEITQYEEEARQALRRLVGNENFEDRTDLEKNRIDRPVFDYLVEKFG